MKTQLPALHYQVEILPHCIAIWRTSIDSAKVYSVSEIVPEPPEPDPLALLLQAMAET